MSGAAEIQSDTTASKHSICLSWPGGRRSISVGPEATLQDIEKQAKYVSNMDKIILKSGFPPRRLIIDKATNAREALPAQTLVVVERDNSGGTSGSSGVKRSSQDEISCNDDSGGGMSRGSGGDTSNSRDEISRKKPRSMTIETKSESWTCAACTFLNPIKATLCEMCDQPANVNGEWNCIVRSLFHAPDAFMGNACGKARVTSSTDHGLVVSDKNKGPPLPLPSTITVVSFNVAGFEPSVSAPAGFDSMTAFSSEILQHQPDIICLQEVPSGMPNVFRGYLSLGSTESHCENVVLLVKEEWAHLARRIAFRGPAVLCQINFSNMTGVEQSIVLGSCHLEPFKEGASIRLGQTRSIVQVVPENLPFIFAGDFNMRQDEDERVEDLGFQDAWKEAGMDFSQKFTWDSYNNCYHAECYQFKCRFDRVYFKQGTNRLLSVKHFSLIGNKPLTNNKHFLSDHFGMMATFEIRE